MSILQIRRTKPAGEPDRWRRDDLQCVGRLGFDRGISEWRHVTAKYVYGPGGLIKELDNNRYYYQDGSGSTSQLADSSGHLLEWYRYDLQGTPLFYNPSDQQISASAFGVRHLFTGQQWYQDIGLYDLRNRFYSPDLGRFLQPDPIGFRGGKNLYRILRK